MNDLEHDIIVAGWFCEKVRTSDSYAQNLYAAMCNMRFMKLDVVPILKDEYWSASWRAAGGIVSRIQGKGDYMDWYCSGMGGFAAFDDQTDEEAKEQFDKQGYVPEGTVTDEIREDLKKIGWIPSEWPDND
jgi:hypothetical protein